MSRRADGVLASESDHVTPSDVGDRVSCRAKCNLLSTTRMIADNERESSHGTKLSLRILYGLDASVGLTANGLMAGGQVRFTELVQSIGVGPTSRMRAIFRFSAQVSFTLIEWRS